MATIKLALLKHTKAKKWLKFFTLSLLRLLVTAQSVFCWLFGVSRKPQLHPSLLMHIILQKGRLLQISNPCIVGKRN